MVTLLIWLSSGQFLNFSLDHLVINNAATDAQKRRNSFVVQYEKLLCDASARGTLFYTSDDWIPQGFTPMVGKVTKLTKMSLLKDSAVGKVAKVPKKSVKRGVKAKKSVRWKENLVSGMCFISKLSKEQVCGIGDDNYYEVAKARMASERSQMGNAHTNAG